MDLAAEVSAGPGSVDEMIARLNGPDVGARRVAILDLIRESAREARANTALLDRLPREADERAALLIIRHFEKAGYTPALAALMRLYETRATPVRIAHAAVNSHDAIQAAASVREGDKGLATG